MQIKAIQEAERVAFDNGKLNIYFALGSLRELVAEQGKQSARNGAILVQS